MYFSLLRMFVTAFIHSRTRIAELLTPKNEEDRLRFYNERWNSTRWKMMHRVFFHRHFMRFFNRNNDVFKSKECDYWKQLYLRSERAMTVLPMHANPYGTYMLTGNFQDALPFYLRSENYDAIRANLDKLVICKGDVKGALEANRGVLFDGFNLSNIFEHMSCDQYLNELQLIVNSSAEKSTSGLLEPAW